MASAAKNEHEIAVGNVTGSCVFNLLAVLMLPALFKPGPVPPVFLATDYPIMLVFILMLWVFSQFSLKHILGRISGALFLLGYVGYIGYRVFMV